MMKKAFIKVLLVLLTLAGSSELFAAKKGLWVWDTSNIVGVSASENLLLNECVNSGVTDIYLYCPNGFLTNSTERTKFQLFITKMSCIDVNVWGMDGWRGYFSDMCGPTNFYLAIQDVIDYNALSLPEEKFFGFHGDNEFHANDSDCGVNAFHSGKTDANLSTSGGSGSWKNTERQDRDSLMADYVKQTVHAAKLCHDADMEYGISIMPWISGVTWTHASIGNQSTPLMANYNNVNKALYRHLMDYVDEYIMMSYHTNVPGKVVPMCEDELAYADGLAANIRPRVYSGLETYCGVAQYVSYCDTPGENTKTHVNNEMTLAATLLGTHVSYSGVAIHDWTGWRGLSTASSNTADIVSCSGTSTGIANVTSSSLAFKVFPNPGNNELRITRNEISKPGLIQIFDSKGALVYSAEQVLSESDFIINTEAFTEGIYFVNISEFKTKWVKN